MNKVQKLYCSFCGKSQDEVERLIAGPNVFICNECVRLCVKILDEPLPSPEQVQSQQAADAFNRGDYKTAIELHLPFAEKGDARAQFWLGHSYEALKDDAEAFKWYQKSAEQREIWDDGCSAQAQMSIMYKWGKGVEQSDEEAYFWRLVAKKSGYPVDDADLIKRLTPEQIATVEERVEEWIKTHSINFKKRWVSPSSEQDRVRQADKVAPQGALAKIVKELITKGKERGYVTYDEMNKALPVGEYTSEQIDETMAMLCDIGINLVEDEPEPPREEK